MNEQRLTNFLGIDFGTNKEIAKEKMLLREGVVFDNENSSDEALFFDGVKFGGRITSYVFLLFFNDKFTKSTVVIKPKLDAYTINTYKEIKEEINSKYYISNSDFETYNEPYYEGDGYTESGIQNGNVEFSCYWSFTDQNNGEDDYIVIRINEDMEITITYEDGDLSDELANKTKEKNNEDY